jgi:rhamnose utilization protein RhaD (predicted bifunctional aldolase and dehydrogenase)
MVGAYAHCTFNLNPRPSSIDTPLHGFVPYAHVDHTHPNAAISVAACAKGKEMAKEIYGDEVIWTEWQRPGFDLGLILEKLCKDHPKAKGAIMGQHGLINWHQDDQKCYELTLELVGRAAAAIAKKDQGERTFGGAKFATPAEKERKALWVSILPWLRGRVSAQQRMIGTVQEDATILRFVNSKDAARLAEMGTSCPDHFLRTKIKPLYVPWDPAKGDLDKLRGLLEEGLEGYRADYKKYYEKCKRKDSPAMRDPNPTVVLIPGLGMVA